MRYHLLLSNDQSCGTMRAGKSRIRKHSFRADPIAGKIDIFGGGLVHRRPSGQPPFARANYGMRDGQTRKESLMNDLVPPSGLKKIHELFELSSIKLVLPIGRSGQILRNVNRRGSLRAKIGPS